MSNTNREVLLGKLNTVCSKTLEEATGVCEKHGYVSVELVDWLHELLQLKESDLYKIINYFGLDVSGLEKNMADTAERSGRASESKPDLSSFVAEAMKYGWFFSALMFVEPQVRSGHILLGSLKNEQLSNYLGNISKEFSKIDMNRLCKNFNEIVHESMEQGDASSGSPKDNTASQQFKQDVLKQFMRDLTEQANFGKVDAKIEANEETRLVIDGIINSVWREYQEPVQTGPTYPTLMDRLQHESYSLDFFWALRLLECANRNLPKLGKSLKPSDDPIRLGQEVSLNYESSTLGAFIPGKDDRPPRLNNRFFGLFGPNGPLPLHLTEYVRNRETHEHDHTLARFADFFHHRLLCFFYKARADVEPTFSFDRPENDRFGDYVGSLLGIGMDTLLNRDAMPDLAKRHYVGYLWHQVKNADGLQAILADFFKLPVTLKEFVGEWLHIQDADLTRLGESPRTGALGLSTVIGSKVWSCQHKFRILFGPLTLSQYKSMLPSGKRLEKLTAIVLNYSGDEYVWDINLILKKDEVPASSLDGFTQLGWNSWLGQRFSPLDAADLVLNPYWGVN